MSEPQLESALWNTAPTLQDEPLTILGGLRAVDGLISFITFFGVNLLLQKLTTLRYLFILPTAAVAALSIYFVILAIRRCGPDGFHWSFLHWAGLLPMMGAVRAKGVTHEPF